MNFTFTNEQLTVIGQALNELSYKLAAPLVNDINRQIQEQQAPVVQIPDAANEDINEDFAA